MSNTQKLTKPAPATPMTEGSILKSLLLFAAPLILANLLQQTYNAVDSIIVGNYVGSDALAAVGSSTALIYLLIAFSQGASIGAGVIVAQYFGARNKDGIQSSVHTALTASIILGLILSVGGILFSRPLLVLMDTPAEVLELAVTYLQIYSCGMVFNVVYNMAAGILTAVGNSKMPLLYLAAAATVHIFMDLLLIVKFQTGVAGAAIATNLSQAAACFLALIFLVRVPAEYQVSLRKLSIKKDMLTRIIRIGLPAGIQNMVISLSNILVQTSVNGFGHIAMAGFGAYMKIDGFNILPILSISMAVTTFVGQNYGAGKTRRIKKGLLITTLIGIVYTAATGILLLYFDDSVMALFSQDPDVIAYGKRAMTFFCPFYWLLAILQAFAGAIRGLGKSMPPMIILLLSLCVFRILWVRFILPQTATIDGIFILYPVSWLLGTALILLYTWKRRKLFS